MLFRTYGEAFAMAFTLILGQAGAQEVTLASAAPVVIKTTPTAGTDNVDPALKEIQVTFSKDMKDASWSWGMQTKDAFPKMSGKPRYLPNKRTCVLPVELEAGKTYVIWVNSAKLTGFKDADGRAAIPYLLVFQTKK